MIRNSFSPTDTALAWRKMSNVERIYHCHLMLAVKGFLTEAESKRVKSRIDGWIKRHLEEGKAEK